MGPWIMFIFLNLALLYFVYLALFQPQVVVGWLGTRMRQKLDRQFRYRAAVRLVGVFTVVGLGVLDWLFLRWG